MKNFLLLVSAAMSLLLATHCQAGGDINAGKIAVEKYGCVACHGADFNTPIDPSYPKLAGQHADYLAHTLVAYQRDFKAPNRRVNAIMNGQAKPLSSKDIQNISAYIHNLPGSLVVRK
ncbi:MAG: cytochrome c [Solimicrobium sp.]|jgi:cytochrome c553|nr:cytochrome c [Solimicrobium sp.]